MDRNATTPAGRKADGNCGVRRGARVERLHQTGFLRCKVGQRAFRFATSSGDRPDPADRERIRRLAVPPAWTEAAIARSPSSRLQAVGRDRAGRWQYLYGEAQIREREERKRRRLCAFIRALPGLRRSIQSGLRAPILSRERVMSAILRIVSVTFLRPGSAVYARENSSYGLATLRRRHVSVQGDWVIFDFPGKSGKRQRREIADRRVARVVRALLQAPGLSVFKYRTDSGSMRNIRRRDINSYIREQMGHSFTVKDFRTWAGTLVCASALGGVEARVGAERPRDRLAAALRETAAVLGNTTAVCRASYVSGAMLRAFEANQDSFRIPPIDLDHVARRLTLSAPERAVLKLLERHRPRMARQREASRS